MSPIADRSPPHGWMGREQGWKKSEVPETPVGKRTLCIFYQSWDSGWLSWIKCPFSGWVTVARNLGCTDWSGLDHLYFCWGGGCGHWEPHQGYCSRRSRESLLGRWNMNQCLRHTHLPKDRHQVVLSTKVVMHLDSTLSETNPTAQRRASHWNSGATVHTDSM